MNYFYGIVASIIIMTASPSIAQSALQPGEYSGGGDWASEDGTSGHYSVSTKVFAPAADAVSSVGSVYHYDNKEESWGFAILPGANGFFLVAAGEAEGSIVGQGYCFEVQCHYTAFDGKLEETLTFVDGKLYKIGSKSFGKSKIKWQEALTLKNPKS